MFAQFKRTALLLIVASPLLVACSSNTVPASDQTIYRSDAGPRITAGEKFAKDAESRGKSRANSNSGLPSSNSGNSQNSGIQGNSEANTGFVPRANSPYAGAPLTRSDAWSQFQGMGMMLLFASVLNGSIFEKGEKIIDNTKSLVGSITGEEKESSSGSVSSPRAEISTFSATSVDSEPSSVDAEAPRLVLTSANSEADRIVFFKNSSASEEKQDGGAKLAPPRIDEDVECLIANAHQAAELSGLNVIFETATESQR
ncbi:MAG: hypothetical protein ACO3LE_00415 [Bdellovibrionota bacterium]